VHVMARGYTVRILRTKLCKRWNDDEQSRNDESQAEENKTTPDVLSFRYTGELAFA
jgi:hypothetical protein